MTWLGRNSQYAIFAFGNVQMDDATKIQRSKMLSKWLRHKPELGGITLSKEGWSTFEEILAAFERAVSRRRDQEPAILVVDAHGAHDSGVQFYPRGKGVWMSDPIPPDFLSVLEDSQAQQENPPAKAPGTPRRRRPRGGFNKQAK